MLLDTGRMFRALLARFGREAQWQPVIGGEPQTVRVIFSPDAQRIGKGGYLTVRHEIQVLSADVAQPAKGDSYQIDADKWLVDSWEPDGEIWTLIMRRAA